MLPELELTIGHIQISFWKKKNKNMFARIIDKKDVKKPLLLGMDFDNPAFIKHNITDRTITIMGKKPSIIKYEQDTGVNLYITGNIRYHDNGYSRPVVESLYRYVDDPTQEM